MKYPNLFRRGHMIWWRRKITVDGHSLTIDLSLRTANLYEARAIADRLGRALERLRMSYGERSLAIAPATLKRIFQDAMRWQLDRIRTAQIGSSEPIAEHRQTNRICGELWRHYAARGAKAPFTQADRDKLIGDGWKITDVEQLEGESGRYGNHVVARRQLQLYAKQFDFQLTPSNTSKVQQVIFSARAEACKAADRELGEYPGDLAHWAEEALESSDPFAFEQCPVIHSDGNEVDLPRPVNAQEIRPELGSSPQKVAPDIPELRLKEAMEACISAVDSENAWSADTIEQTRAAIRLFDFACGENVTIEAITKTHFLQFRDLCEKLPNRWGRTKAEKIGGISASLARAEEMDPSLLGMSQATCNKHLTWISRVLAFAASDRGGKHCPTDLAAVEKAIREARQELGEKAVRMIGSALETSAPPGQRPKLNAF